jgi:lysyl-tRNA synthetase class 2
MPGKIGLRYPQEIWQINRRRIDRESRSNVNVAGRLVAIRRMGKASFVNLKDEYGTIQAWIGINVIGEHDYKRFKLADLGDIVGLEGTLMLTRTGELTIRVSKYTHITKCLKPLPEKFHGLTDTGRSLSETVSRFDRQR